MKKLFTKSISIFLLTAILVSALIGAIPAEAATKAKANSPALVSSVTHYEWNSNAKKWEKRRIVSYKYKNAYPTAITETDCYEGSVSTTKCAYTFRKNGTPKHMTATNDTGSFSISYNSKGARTDMVSKNASAVSKKFFQFAENKSYFTMVLHHDEFYKQDNPAALDFSMEEADSVLVTMAGGLLKKTVNAGLYANVNAGEKKNWERFNGTYRADYDADGVLKQTSAKFRSGPSGKQDSFVITKKNGRITQVVRRHWTVENGKKGRWETSEKIVFKYTNTKITKARYAMMINAAIIGSDNNFYLYYWY